MRRMFVVALLVGLVAPGVPAGAHTTGGTVTGFENPESAPWDSATGAFYVSNIGPGPINPLGREPDGYLSKISAAGRLESAKWVTGLRSPKGIHRWGDDLLGADVGQLVVIDVAGAKIRRTIDLDGLGAKFPNDVTVDDGTGDAYVSDTGRNAIYRLPAQRVDRAWADVRDVERPGGPVPRGALRVLEAPHGPARVGPGGHPGRHQPDQQRHHDHPAHDTLPVPQPGGGPNPRSSPGSLTRPGLAVTPPR